ncbi:putative glycoside hydrolase [Clostridium grantii]|uniref:SH3b domain-containing protein n=1 Tax=Clostridium grantii DSM 8605 TaxID=1121316 RepID=A0A1M5UNQ4_9CLOT|nr:putative glycoside hydrolase [Clostridium grantii]SHH64635.1 hypothetical protein SAMN02745207_01852 [Clostridium grantii DSM 8605]
MKKTKVLIFMIGVSLLTTNFMGCSNSTSQKNQNNSSVENNIENNNKEVTEEKEDTKIDESTNDDQKTANDDSIIGKEVYINANPLIIREESNSNSKKVGLILKGEAVTVEEEINDDTNGHWYKISFEDTQGFISADYVVSNKYELISPEFKDLEYSAQDKKIYENNKPVKVKGVYVTKFSTVSQNFDYLIDIAEKSGINTFVIDVKDDRGEMLFYTDAANKFAPKANDNIVIKDIKAFIEKLKEHNIYAIARIVSFKDPIYGEAHPDRTIVYKDTGEIFKNSDELSWVSAYDKNLWEYNVAVAKEAAEAGFNEIQFDYVRFPASDGGKLDKVLDYRNNDNESKAKAIQEYLMYGHKELEPYEVYIGADIYGLVASVTNDMSLGQYWEAISNVVDYICPMIYPSHYANGTYEIPIPDADPYGTVFYSTKDAVRRNGNVATPAIIRPWIQDFTAPWVKGHIKYGENELKAQIKALEENGVDEYLLWNAGNKYSYEAVK